MSDRQKLPTVRRSITHKAVIHAMPEICPHCGKQITDGRIKFFLTVGFFEDGRPGEIFLHMDESGSTLDGLADCWAMAVSLCLQSGIVLEKIVEKFAYQQFEPMGMTDNNDIHMARSIVDYVCRWMMKEIGGNGEKEE